jgi:DNA-binding transcriptional LysR family regulator
MSKFSISDLENFLETSQHLTLSQAAKKLQISQPALSGSVKRLELTLGYELFYRSKRGIQLTANGKIFLSKAKDVISALINLESKTSKNQIFEGRIITIGCHEVVAQYCLPNAFSHLKSVAPDYKIDLVHDLSRKILAEIQLGRIDIGVLINPTKLPDLVIRPVAMDTIGIWRARKSKSFDTIICEQDLFQTQSILKRWKQKTERVLQTSSLELMCHLVMADVGWGIIPERAVLLSGLDLVMESKLPTYKDEICIVTRPEFGKSSAEKLVLEALKIGLN